MTPPSQAPDLIAKALNLDSSAVTTSMLRAYRSASVAGAPAEVLTLWLGLVPSSVVDDLQGQLKAANSAFYNQTGLLGELADQVDPSYPLVSLSSLSSASSGSNGAVGSGIHDADGEADEGDAASRKRRDIIIGVTVSVGGALWVGLVGYIYRRLRRKAKADIHRRMSMNPTLSGRNLAAVQLMAGHDARSAAAAGGAAGHSSGGRSSSVDLDARPSSFYAFDGASETASNGGSSRCVSLAFSSVVPRLPPTPLFPPF